MRQLSVETSKDALVRQVSASGLPTNAELQQLDDNEKLLRDHPFHQLTLDKLKALCKTSSLTVSGDKFTLVDRLVTAGVAADQSIQPGPPRDPLYQNTAVELIERCAKEGLSSRGKKEELVERILKYGAVKVEDPAPKSKQSSWCFIPVREWIENQAGTHWSNAIHSALVRSEFVERYAHVIRWDQMMWYPAISKEFLLANFRGHLDRIHWRSFLRQICEPPSFMEAEIDRVGGTGVNWGQVVATEGISPGFIERYRDKFPDSEQAGFLNTKAQPRRVAKEQLYQTMPLDAVEKNARSIDWAKLFQDNVNLTEDWLMAHQGLVKWRKCLPHIHFSQAFLQILLDNGHISLNDVIGSEKISQEMIALVREHESEICIRTKDSHGRYSRIKLEETKVPLVLFEGAIDRLEPALRRRSWEKLLTNPRAYDDLEFLRRNIEQLSWPSISCNRATPISFLEENIHLLDRYCITLREDLPFSFLEQNLSLIDWDVISLRKDVPIVFLEKYITRLCWDNPFIAAKLPLSFVDKYFHLIPSDRYGSVISRKDLTTNFLSKHWPTMKLSYRGLPPDSCFTVQIANERRLEAALRTLQRRFRFTYWRPYHRRGMRRMLKDCHLENERLPELLEKFDRWKIEKPSLADFHAFMATIE